LFYGLFVTGGAFAGVVAGAFWLDSRLSKHPRK
jgi:hypothetical protein